MTALLPLVQMLASLDASPAQRNQAARTMLQLLQQSERKLLGSLSGLTAEDREDAILHVMDKASLGTARCQAQHEAEAWAWCISVARNFGLGLLKKQRRQTPLEEHHDHGQTGDGEHHDLRQQTQEFFEKALDHVRASPRGADKEAGIQCAIEHVFKGVDIAEQIEKWGFPDGKPSPMTEVAHRRARNRVYAYRSRGIDYLLDALDALEAQGLPPEDTVFLKTLLKQRKRGKTLSRSVAVRTPSPGSHPPSHGSIAMPRSPLSDSIFAVLEPEHLPAYLTPAAREALSQPDGNPVLAAISAGQLLRAGALRGAVRSHLRAWLARLDAEQLDILGEVAEQHLAESARHLHLFASHSPDAQELLEAAELTVDGEAPDTTRPQPSTLAADWLKGCVLPRDRAESLAVALGVAALDSTDPAAQDLATSREQSLRISAQSIDQAAQALGVLLGDEARDWCREPWFEQVAALEPEHWWMALAYARPAAQRVAASPVPRRPLAPVLELRLRPRTRPAPAPALAAHGGDAAPPVSGSESKELRHGSLWIELTSIKDTDQPGDFLLNLWLTDDSTLDLSGGAVQVLDAQQSPLKPLNAGPRPRRWWGYFRGEGSFELTVAGLEQPIKLVVRRGE